MTEQHVHEWRWYSEHGEDGIDCRLCEEEHGYRPENWMGGDEVIRRLNATERLMQAIGEYLRWVHSTSDEKDIALRGLEKAYADTLEVKDD